MFNMIPPPIYLFIFALPNAKSNSWDKPRWTLNGARVFPILLLQDQYYCRYRYARDLTVMSLIWVLYLPVYSFLSSILINRRIYPSLAGRVAVENNSLELILILHFLSNSDTATVVRQLPSRQFSYHIRSSFPQGSVKNTPIDYNIRFSHWGTSLYIMHANKRLGGKSKKWDVTKAAVRDVIIYIS